MSTFVSLDAPNNPSRLYTYCLRWDDGAAPNPFWGVCTLVICKPRIRMHARKGDWIIGTGPKWSKVGDLSGRLVYAMRVDEVLTLEEYDAWAHKTCPKKLPEWNHHDFRRRRGDAIYDFSSGRAKQRQSVHGPANMPTDLSGLHALISRHFYYFGRKAVEIPDRFRPIIHQTQGEKYKPNAHLLLPFVKWLEALGYTPNKVHGNPAMWEEDDSTDCRLLASCRKHYCALAETAARRAPKATVRTC